MAIILNTSINLSDIPKDKIIDGKKGKYLPLTITINNELDKFGNSGPVTVAQSMEERQNKSAKTYLGNVKVVWTDGQPATVAPREGQPQQQSAPVANDDLPF